MKNLLIIILALFSLNVQAQNTFECGTQSIPIIFPQDTSGGLNLAKSSPGLPDVDACLPINFHIIKKSDGSKGASEREMNIILANINHVFNKIGITFYIPNYGVNIVEDDFWYNNYTTNTNAFHNQYFDSKAFNIVLTDIFNIAGVSTFAPYANAYNPNSKSGIVCRNNSSLFDEKFGYKVLSTPSHEMGHVFSLLHTHQNTNLGNSYSNPQSHPPTVAENVTRDPLSGFYNCNVAGDFVCDTHADPHFITDNTHCAILQIPFSTWSGDLQDIAGEHYYPEFLPNLNNIMSYYNRFCKDQFTEGQYNRMANAYAAMQVKGYLFNAPILNSVAPSGLTTTRVSQGIELNWVDNSLNEKGFIIERSESGVNSTFIAVELGGVASNTTTFLDRFVESNKSYWYRVRPSNNNCGGNSNISAITSDIVYCLPFNSSNNLRIHNIQFFDGTTNVLSNPTTTDVFYNDYTNLSFSVVKNSNYSFSVNGSANNANFHIWIDYNQDGDFDDVDEYVFSVNGTQGNVANGNFTIPSHSLSGNTRLRVLHNLPYGDINLNLLSESPCGVKQYSKTEDYTINVISPFTISTTTTDNTCYQSNDGSMIVNVSGGQVPYEYSLDGINYQTINTFNNLSSGNYTIWIRDANYLIEQQNGNFIEEGNSNLDIQINAVTDVSCNAGNDGEIDVIGLNGASPYEYSIDGINFQASSLLSGLSAGFLSVSVQDDNDCNYTINGIEVSEPNILTATAINICDASTTNSIAINVNGGQAPYQFSIDGINYQSSNVFNGLSSGVYSLYVRDVNLCSFFIPNHNLIVAPSTSNFNVNATVKDFCPASVLSHGIEFTMGNWSPASSYEYSIDGVNYNNITTPSSTTFVYTPGPGSYDLFVREIGGCPIVLPNLIVNTIDFQATFNITNASCPSSNNGSIEVIPNNISGHTLSYSIASIGSTQPYPQSQPIFSGLAPGNYNVSIGTLGCRKNFLLEVGSNFEINLITQQSSCSNGNDGAINLIVSGGSAPLSFDWDNDGIGDNDDTQNLVGLPAGNYNIVVTDNAGCTLNSNASIIQESITIDNLLTTNVNCPNDNNGGINISISGGDGTYVFDWDNDGVGDNDDDKDLNNLSVGVYSLTISDGNGCSTSTSGTISSINALPIITNIDTEDVSSCGGHDGSMDVYASIGFPWDISIDNGLNWTSTGNNTFTGFNSLTAGTYDILVRNAYNCVTNGNALISEPPLDVTLSLSNVQTCVNETNFLLSGGSPAGGVYGGTYVNNGYFDASLAGIGIHSVTYTVNYANGCTNSATDMIEVFDLPQIALTKTDKSCINSNDGTITANITGGSGTLSYAWSDDGGLTNFAFTIDPGLLSVGTYSLTVSDAIGCSNTESISIVNPNPITVDLNALEQPKCIGSSDGAIYINTSGGSGSYNFLWSDGSVSEDLTNVPPGNYSVTVSDANGSSCGTFYQTSLISPPSLLFSVSTSYNNCGTTFTPNVYGGTGGLSYSWIKDNGPTVYSTNPVISNLQGGTYNLTVTDANNCSVDNSYQTSDYPPINITATPTNPSCSNSSDGDIQIYALGGLSQLSYSWTNIGGTPFSSNSKDISNLLAGTYELSVTDGSNCTYTEVVTLVDPLPLSAAYTSSNITCNNADDGVITITASGGTAPLNYSIDNGANFQTSNSFNGLEALTYNVVVEDANGCQISIPNSVTFTEPNLLSANVSSSYVTCNGANDGSINITNALGSSNSYEYSIDGGTTWAGFGSFTGLGANSYNVQIRDASVNSCVVVLNNALVISQPAALTAAVSATDITCNGADDGNIIITNPMGGNNGFEYSIDGGNSWSTNSNFSSSSQGSYDVRIRDDGATNCVVSLASFTFTEPDALTAAVAATDITCNGADDGNIIITNPMGGNNGFEYSIDGGNSWSTNSNFSSLSQGSYDVRIRDDGATNCVVSLASFTFTEPDALTAAVAATDITCNGADDGNIIITNPMGGNNGFEYSIDGGNSWSTNSNFSSLSQGSYDVRIRDDGATNCVVSLASFTFTEPDALTAAVSATDITCNGADDGNIIITNPMGGNNGFEYSIDGGNSWSTNSNFSSLSQGSYDVRIRDDGATNCVVSLASFTFTEPDALTAAVAATDITCNGADDGNIIITNPMGGNNGFEYSIDGGNSWSTNSNFSSLSQGSYDVRIRDDGATNCVVSLASFTFTEPDALTAAVAATDITCNGADDGNIIITNPMGGNNGFEYSIDGGNSWSTNSNFSSLSQGSYDVRIRDDGATNCVVSLASFTFTEPDALTAAVAATDITCNGADDGNIIITNPMGGNNGFEYSIDGGNSWSTNSNFSSLSQGSYDVRIRDGGATNCVVSLASFTFTEPDALTAAVAATDITCNGADDGNIIITNPMGGNNGFEYSIDGGNSWSTNSNFSSLSQGSYDVRIRDDGATNCVVSLASFTFTEPDALTAAVAATDITCNGADDGNIIITNPMGGNNGFEYSIDGGNSWSANSNFSSLSQGSYDVRIRDDGATNCVVSLASFTFTEPDALTAAVSATDITCNGADDGNIIITNPMGGNNGFEYSIDGGNSWSANSNFSSLSQGSYDVRIRDDGATNCVVSLASFTFTEPDALTAAVSATDITCNGADDGNIIITNPMGGNNGFEYSIDGGNSWSANSNFSSLSQGSYDVRIRDDGATNCVVSLASFTFTEPDALTAAVSATDITCNGADDGNIIITNPMGGNNGFEYSIDGGNSWSANSNFSSLSQGSYDVRIRDDGATNCVVSLASFTFTEPDALTAAVAATDITCNGADDGNIIITNPMGGNNGFEYSIDGGNSWSTNSNFSSLSQGSYDVRIRDDGATNCVVSLASFTFTEPDALTAAVAATDITCNGADDGNIIITNPMGGNNGFEYSIDGGNSWSANSNFSSLSQGSYDVRIRDDGATNCVVSLASFTFTEPDALTAAVAATDITCNGADDGNIIITNPMGGNNGFEYSIDGGNSWSANSNFSSLSQGSYDVRIRDDGATNCVVSLASFTFTEPDALTAAVAATDITCNGADDGNIIITNPMGGNNGFEYSIDGGNSWSANSNFSSLSQGSYDVRIRDDGATNCVVSLASFTFTEPDALTAAVAATDITCNGADDGNIIITNPMGGNNGFEYSIDGGNSWSTNSNFSSLSQGSYDVRIRDDGATNCVVSLASFTFTEPDALTAAVAATDITCNGADDGNIIITNPMGGNNGFEYSIDGGNSWSANSNFSSLSQGSYDVRIRDDGATNCVVSLASFTFTEPDALTAAVAATDITCNGADDGNIIITNPMGGNNGFEYSIDGGNSWSTNSNFSSLSQGSYDVRIRDDGATNCVVSLASFTFTEPDALTAAVSATDITCNGADDGVITITASGGTAPLNYSIDNGANFQTSNSFNALGASTYDVVVKDANDCQVSFLNSVTLTNPNVLSANVSSTDVTCSGANDGSINVTNALGGSNSYEYSIDGGVTWVASGSFAGLSANNYDVQIRDALVNSCVVVLNNAITISEPNIPNNPADIINGLTIANTQTVNWVSSKHVIGNITIEDGGVLNISGGNTKIFFDGNISLNIEYGGVLNVVDAELTATCEESFWKGLRIFPDPGVLPWCATPPGPLPQNTSVESGEVHLNNVLIEYAETGLKSYFEFNDWTGAPVNVIFPGGIISATNNTRFKDCNVGIEYAHGNFSQDETYSPSFTSVIDNCIFECTGPLPDQDYQGNGTEIFIIKHGWNSDLNITNSEFINNPTLPINKKAIGIKSYGNINNIRGNTFTNLSKGLEIIDANEIGGNAISDKNIFTNVEKGIYITGSADILYNSFVAIPPGLDDSDPATIDDTYGLFVIGEEPHWIEGNEFFGSNIPSPNPSVAASYGVVFEQTGNTYVNFFANYLQATDIGLQVEGMNEDLKVRCNSFAYDQQAHNIAAWTLVENATSTLYGGGGMAGSLRPQGTGCLFNYTPAGNEWHDPVAINTNKDIVFGPNASFFYYAAHNSSSVSGAGRTLPDNIDVAVYNSWTSAVNVDKLDECFPGTPGHFKTSTSCDDGSQGLVSPPGGGVVVSGSINTLLGIKATLSNKIVNLKAQLTDPENQLLLVAELKATDKELQDVVYELSKLYKETDQIGSMKTLLQNTENTAAKKELATIYRKEDDFVKSREAHDDLEQIAMQREDYYYKDLEEKEKFELNSLYFKEINELLLQVKEDDRREDELLNWELYGLELIAESGLPVATDAEKILKLNQQSIPAHTIEKIAPYWLQNPSVSISTFDYQLAISPNPAMINTQVSFNLPLDMISAKLKLIDIYHNTGLSEERNLLVTDNVVNLDVSNKLSGIYAVILEVNGVIVADKHLVVIH